MTKSIPPSFERPHPAELGRATPAVTTETLAHAIGVKPNSIRVRLCRTGSYFGLRPIKMPNGRLVWPGDSFGFLAAQGE